VLAAALDVTKSIATIIHEFVHKLLGCFSQTCMFNKPTSRQSGSLKLAKFFGETAGDSDM
jgi:hypothetical protein